MEEKKGINKLLLIAAIITPAIWIVYCVVTLKSGNVPLIKGTSRSTNSDFKIGLIIFVIVLLIMAIPTLLNVFGGRKNNKVMILIAGIIYIFTLIGIPSAILCFVANAGMKKQVTQG